MISWIDSANVAAERWAAWMSAGLLEGTFLLVVVGLLWLAIRRRVAPQVGYVLFLLVPLKLVLPSLVVAVPAALAAWSPAGLVAAWGSDHPAAPVVELAAHPAPVVPTPMVPTAPAPIAPRPAMTVPALPSIRATPAAAVLPAHPRLTGRAGLMLAWLVGVLGLSGRLLGNLARFRTHLARLTPVDPSLVPLDLAALARQAGVGRPVRFLEDGSIDSPAVAGIWRPSVLLPRGMAESLPVEQLRWVLLHELAHVRRFDLAVVAMQRVAAILNFVNPVVWVANRLIDQLREYACDDLAVALGEASPVEAGAAFVAVLRQSRRPRRGLDGALGFLGFDTRTACFRRVHRLLDTDRPICVSLGLPARCALILAAVGALPSVRATSTPPSAWPQEPASKVAQPSRPVPKAALAEVPPLRDGGDLELTVVGPGGKPVPGALVDFRDDPVPTAELVRRGKLVGKRRYGVAIEADTEGKIVVSFPKVPTGLTLDITIPGYGSYWAIWSSTANQIIPARFTAELDPGWSVGGIVVDADGKPVSGAQVVHHFESKKRPGDFRQMGAAAYRVTDASGRWRYDSIPGSMTDVQVSIDKAEFRPLQRSLGRGEFGIEPGREPSARIALDRGLTVVGTVTDETGKPIVGATVRTKFINEIREAKTWADGTYKLVGCEAMPARIVVSSQGRATDMKPVIVAAAMDPVNFAMAPGGVVRIKVLNSRGQPEPRARIFFQQWRGKRIEYFEFANINQYADEFGEWVWNEAPLDEFRADICPSGDSGMQLVGQPIVPRAEPYVFNLPATLEVSGRVIDAETKEPVQRFRVTRGGRWNGGRLQWDDRGASEATAGRFQLRDHRVDGTFLIRVEADGYEAAISRDIQANEGSIPLDFELKRGRSIAMKVITPDLKPAAGAKVAVGIEGAQIVLKNGDFDLGSTFAAIRPTDDEGRCSVSPRDKPFLLLITHPTGYARVNVDGPWDTIRIVRLVAWAQVEGTFRIGAEPAANVALILSVANVDTYGPGQPHISSSYLTTTGPDGRYRFDRVIPGLARLNRDNTILLGVGSKEKSSSIASRVDLPAGKTTTFHFGGAGRPVVGKLAQFLGATEKVEWNFAQIWGQSGADVPPENSVYFTATVDRDGTFRIDDVPSGSFVLSVRMQQDPNSKLTNHPFEVSAADPANPRAPIDLGTIPMQAAIR